MNNNKPLVKKVRCNSNVEWRIQRANSIGASAVPAILGISPFSTAAALAARMRDEMAGKFDYSESYAMLRGHAYESGIAYLFSRFSGHEIIQSTAAEYLVIREDIPFLHASPDRIYWLDANGPQHGAPSEDNKGVLECKTTRTSISRDSLPLHWVVQLHTQMGITGYHSGAIACDQLHKAKQDAFVFDFFSFDEDLFKFIVEKCRIFWNDSILGNRKPANNLPELQASFPYLFNASKRKFTLFERLRRSKDIVDCLPPQTLQTLRQQPASAPETTTVKEISLPEVDDDNDDNKSSWIERIWK